MCRLFIILKYKNNNFSTLYIRIVFLEFKFEKMNDHDHLATIKLIIRFLFII
jgi:hypothetical protein